MTKERKSQPYFEVICDTHGLVVESADEALVEAVLNEHVWNPACHNVIRRKVGPGSDVQIRASAEVLVPDDQHISGPLDQAVGFRGRITPTSWLPPRPDMTIESWMAEVALLVLMRDRLQWCLGDALLYGETRYGEMWSQVADQYHHHTLENCRWVASRFEHSRRRESLSFGHHEAVAKLNPEQQDDWLDRAVREAMPRETLRKALRGETAEVETHACPLCGRMHRA